MLRIPKPDTPPMIASRIAFRHEAVGETSAGQRPAAKVDAAIKLSRDEHVSGAVTGNAVAILIRGITEAMAPYMRTAGGTQLGKEDVRPACPTQPCAAAEIKAPLIVAGEEAISSAIGCPALAASRR